MAGGSSVSQERNQDGNGSTQVNFFQKLISEKATKHLLLTTALVGLIALGVNVSADWSYRRGRELLTNLRHSESLYSEQEKPPRDPPELRFAERLQATPEEKARLTSQLEEVRKRARFHLQAAVFIFANYYMSTIVFCLTGAVAAIALIIVSNKGWKEANDHVINVFFVMTAATVFFGAFPELFRQEQSVDDNKLLYLRCIALEDELLTYVATGAHPPVELRRLGGQQAGEGAVRGATAEGVGTGGSGPGPELCAGTGDSKDYLEPRCFSLYVDRELARGGIPIGLDHSKVPSWTDAFNGGVNAQRPTP